MHLFLNKILRGTLVSSNYSSQQTFTSDGQFPHKTLQQWFSELVSHLPYNLLFFRGEYGLLPFLEVKTVSDSKSSVINSYWLTCTGSLLPFLGRGLGWGGRGFLNIFLAGVQDALWLLSTSTYFQSSYTSVFFKSPLRKFDPGALKFLTHLKSLIALGVAHIIPSAKERKK